MQNEGSWVNVSGILNCWMLCQGQSKSYNWCCDGSELFPCQLLKLYVFILCPEVKGFTLGTPYLIASDLSPLNRLQRTGIIPTNRPGKSVYNHWCQLGQQGIKRSVLWAFVVSTITSLQASCTVMGGKAKGWMVSVIVFASVIKHFSGEFLIHLLYVRLLSWTLS